VKVIQELVQWFDRRGLLSEADLAALNEQGLLAQDAPRTMLEHCGRVGRGWCFRVVGELEGPVWGTDVYTGDSSVASAVLRVVVVEPPERFEGSLRHGVASRDYARYDTAFRFEAMPPASEG
jgi:hypothetical protein